MSAVIENYGEWPDYMEDVVSGEIWLTDPFAPGTDPPWTRGESYTSQITGLTWFKYTRRECL